jgi:hypothetical protein
MLNYLNNFYNYIWGLFFKEIIPIKFEKPRAYKNLASHEPRKLKRQYSYYS